MCIAIITARGGSKRIPHKNIKPFLGKPIIAWPIQAARASGLFSRIIVSTDDEAIADVSRKYGAEVPFMRPAEFADDYSTTSDVLLHALKWLDINSILPDIICCIYPTASLLQIEDLISGHSLIISESNPSSVFSATPFDFPILRALKLQDDGTVNFNWPEFELTRSQDLPCFFHDAGQFYWINVRKFLFYRKLVMPDSRIIMLPRCRVQDIDTDEDWLVAENMAKFMSFSTY